MPEELEKSYRRARNVSLAGAGVMYLLMLLAILNFLVQLYAIAQGNALDSLPLEQTSALLACAFVPIPLELLLAEFLRNFGNGRSPFGGVQSARLAGAGLLALLYSVLEAFVPAIAGTSVVTGAVPVVISSGPGIRFGDLTMVVFLLCLAIVIKYGNALKDDSDSIA